MFSAIKKLSCTTCLDKSFDTSAGTKTTYVSLIGKLKSKTYVFLGAYMGDSTSVAFA